jgi:hypothetical protein
LILSKKQKEELVIQLASKGWSTRAIASEVHISLKDIGLVLKRYTGEDIEPSTDKMSTTSKAFKMFSEEKSKVQVAIALNLEDHEVVALFCDFLGLLNLDRLIQVYHALDDNRLDAFYHLFILMEEAGLLSKTAMARLVERGGNLNTLDEECLNLCGQIGRLNERKVELENKCEEMTSLLAFLRRTCAMVEKERSSRQVSV